MFPPNRAGAQPMDLSKIKTGENPPYDVNVVIEIPLGGNPVKYELDKVSGAMYVDRFLYTAMFYPGNYGFIPHTLAADGDPRSEEHTSELQSHSNLVCRLLLEKK